MEESSYYKNTIYGTYRRGLEPFLLRSWLCGYFDHVQSPSMTFIVIEIFDFESASALKAEKQFCLTPITSKNQFKMKHSIAGLLGSLFLFETSHAMSVSFDCMFTRCVIYSYFHISIFTLLHYSCHIYSLLLKSFHWCCNENMPRWQSISSHLLYSILEKQRAHVFIRQQ